MLFTTHYVHHAEGALGKAPAMATSRLSGCASSNSRISGSTQAALIGDTAPRGFLRHASHSLGDAQCHVMIAP